MINAVYQLENRGDPIATRMVFATGSKHVTEYKVWLNSIEIEAVGIPEADLPELWKAPATTPGINHTDRLSFELEKKSRFAFGWQIPEYRKNSRLLGILDHLNKDLEAPLAFDVFIPTGRSDIRVRYISELGVNRSGVPCFHQFAYIFEPARQWASFGRLEIEVVIPEDWTVASSLDLKREGMLMTGTFKGVPAANMTMTLQAPRLWFYYPLKYLVFGFFILLNLSGFYWCWRLGFWITNKMFRIASSRKVFGYILFFSAVSSIAWTLVSLSAFFLIPTIILNLLPDFYLNYLEHSEMPVFIVLLFVPVAFFGGFPITFIAAFIGEHRRVKQLKETGNKRKV